MAHTLWELTSENLVRLEILLERFGLPAAKVGSLRLANDARQSYWRLRDLRRVLGNMAML